MVRPGLRHSYAIDEARRDRKRAPLSGEDLITKISDNIRFMLKISKEDVDKEFFECLKDYYFYDINSLSYKNECGNDGCTNEVQNKDEADPQHMMIGGSTEGFEIGDEDEVDSQYEMFLANAKQDGQFYAVKVDLGDGSPVLIKYEKERKKRKNEIMNRKLSMVKSGVCKRPGKCRSKIKSGGRAVIEKWNKAVNFTGKEKASDVAKDDIEILDNNSGMLKIVENLTGCPQMTVRSEFREKVMDLLKKPYDSNEYKELWTEINNRKLMERNIDLRSGEVKNYKTKQLGKSYLDHYEDLKEKLTKIDDSKRKKLKILRGFFFWLQNLGYADAFAPWKDAEFLALVDESS